MIYAATTDFYPDLPEVFKVITLSPDIVYIKADCNKKVTHLKLV
jgi:hypothetical protein